MERPFDLITFDFDGVLLHNDYHDHFFRHCRTLGLRWQAEREPTLLRFIHDFFGSGESQRVREAHGAEGFWPQANRRFLAALAAEGELERAAHSLAEQMQRIEVAYFHETGVHELLVRLREAGYRLAMLTNRNEEVRTFGAAWGLIEPFEFIGTRDTVGKAKPEPHLFHHIAERFAVVPERALHIGDNPYADVVGAQAAGWHALLIDPDDLFPDWDVPRLPTLRDLEGWLQSM